MTRQRFSTQVEHDLQQRVRATVRGVAAGTGTDYTLAQFVEDALRRHCDHLEDTHNSGDHWPTTTAPLRPGQRVRT